MRLSLIVLILIALVAGSIFAEAACQSGQMATLNSSTEFLREESNGNTLKLTLGAGSLVQIKSRNAGKTEVLASADFQGQSLTVLAELENSIAEKALNCVLME